MRKQILSVFILMVLLCFSTDDSYSQTGKKAKPEQSLTVGILGVYFPDYEGSDFYEYRAYPIINYNYKNVFFTATDGLGIKLVDVGFFELSTAVGYEGGREEDDAMILNGTGDIDEGAAAIVNFELKYGRFSLGGKYQKQFTGENTGYTIEYKLGYFMPVSKYFIVSSSLSATYGNDRYMEKFFGINSEQAANSVHSIYVAEAGFKNAGAGLVFIINLTEKVAVQVITSYKRFIGDAKDSPIVLDKDQYFTGLGISYKF